MKCKHIIFLVLCCDFYRMTLNQSIPTKQEQANLLLNVQEVFEEVKLMIKEETGNTEKSFLQEIGITVKRAEYILGLLEEMTLLRLSCDSNSVCMLGYRPMIKQIAADGRESLRECAKRNMFRIENSTMTLSNITNSAIDRGQQFLDLLGDCSKKNGIAVIACYRNVIATEVIPVKLKLLESIMAHKEAHNEVIKTRRAVNDCVDENIQKSRDIMEKTLKEALSCK